MTGLGAGCTGTVGAAGTSGGVASGAVDCPTVGTVGVSVAASGTVVAQQLHHQNQACPCVPWTRTLH
jgi:hypothetical protein